MYKLYIEYRNTFRNSIIDIVNFIILKQRILVNTINYLNDLYIVIQ